MALQGESRRGPVWATQWPRAASEAAPAREAAGRAGPASPSGVALGGQDEPGLELLPYRSTGLGNESVLTQRSFQKAAVLSAAPRLVHTCL